MIVFVSYARQDNDLDALRQIERRVAAIGRPYVDDLYDHGGYSRRENVEQALWSAVSLVAVVSPNYLKTAWTRKELNIANHRRIPILFLQKDGTFTDRLGLEGLRQAQ